MAEEEGRFGGRRELFQAPERPQQLEEAQRAHEFLQPAGLYSHSSEPAAVSSARDSSSTPNTNLVHEPHVPRPLHLGGDLRPRRLDQPPILHARGARRFARPAGQAQADVLQIGGPMGAPSATLTIW